MPNPVKTTAWTLCDERGFIDRIAAHYGRDRKAQLPSAARCLQGYLTGLELRWCDLNSHGIMSPRDRKALLRYATARIKQLAAR